MTAYSYNSQTMEYSEPIKCQIDPLATIAKGKTVYLLPADSTFIAPPEYDEETEIVIWSGEAWKIKQKEAPIQEELIEQPNFIANNIDTKIRSIVDAV